MVVPINCHNGRYNLLPNSDPSHQYGKDLHLSMQGTAQGIMLALMRIHSSVPYEVEDWVALPDKATCLLRSDQKHFRWSKVLNYLGL